MNYPISGAVFTIGYAAASQKMRRWMTISLLSVMVFLIGIDKTYDADFNTHYSLGLWSWVAVIVFVANAWTYPAAVRANREKYQNLRAQWDTWTGAPSAPATYTPPMGLQAPTLPVPARQSAPRQAPEPDPSTEGPTLWIPSPSKRIRRRSETDDGIQMNDRRAVDPETL